MTTFSALTSDVERNPQILEGMKQTALDYSAEGYVRVSVRGTVTTVTAVD